MSAIRRLVCVAMLSAGFSLATAANESPQSASAARCTALMQTDFSRVPDALTQITAAQPDGSPAYCQVSGYVAPSVGFVARLPLDRWNGKLIELGCHGMCGSTDHIVQCDDPLRRGYACIVSDGGHKGGAADAKWARNNLEAKIDLAYRAAHVTALAGKAIVERYYGSVARKSYFMGCSRGGLMALQEAQKFPDDFDGIIAGAPGPRFTGQWLDRLWKKRAITDTDGSSILDASDIDLLHASVVEQCDLQDGIEDRLISDPRTCHFDPARLLCSAGAARGCLTPKQLDAVKKIYSGPIATTGERIAYSTALPGSERNWLDTFAGVSDSFLGDGFRYTLFWPDLAPTWNLADFNFDRDSTRITMAASLWEPGPDLRAFKASGGKLLAYMGWADVAAGPLAAIDYYETAERIVGSRSATRDFFRLFMIPGMNHCTGGEGAFTIDYLGYLESWVERNEPPERLLGAHVAVPGDKHDVEFSRPVYPYPVRAKYRGHGDPKSADSFVPATSRKWRE